VAAGEVTGEVVDDCGAGCDKGNTVAVQEPGDGRALM